MISTFRTWFSPAAQNETPKKPWDNILETDEFKETQMAVFGRMYQRLRRGNGSRRVPKLARRRAGPRWCRGVCGTQKLSGSTTPPPVAHA